MALEIEKLDRCTVVKVGFDKLNSSISPELKSLLNETITNENNNIILDLSQCTYCDSSGLSAILIGNRLCQGSKGSFALSGLNDTILNLIKLSRLDTILKYLPTISEAHDYILLQEIENEFNTDI
ncbi:MAG: STAS domain-containing protein [Salibacteraceae bacterium]